MFVVDITVVGIIISSKKFLTFSRRISKSNRKLILNLSVTEMHLGNHYLIQ